MKIEIDIDSLSDDEQYHLVIGLEKIAKPSQSCKEAIIELRRLATESFNKLCREHPYDWV